MKKNTTVLAMFVMLFSLTVQSQVTVTESPDAQDLTDFFEGAAVEISNLTINCPGRAHGFFDAGANSIIGIDQGYIITTGRANNLIGPNNMANRSTNNVLEGDSSLSVLAGEQTYDASVIEFDMVPQYNMILFDFSFGSEEYPEYVGLFNDVFAVFASGEGIDGEQNYALLPNTELMVGVNSINNGYAASGIATGPCTNCEYFIENFDGTELQYDGFTNVITGVIHVVPQSTYHIKIAIADLLDRIYDSGVFFTWYSFRSVQDIATGINESPDKAIRFYPNPMNETTVADLSASGMKSYTFSLTDISGKVVISRFCSQERFEFSKENLSPGIYFAEFTDGTAIIREKLVVN